MVKVRKSMHSSQNGWERQKLVFTEQENLGKVGIKCL